VAAGVTAIVQARMGSTRLVGKTLAEIDGRPLLWQVCRRVMHSESVDRLAIATTTCAEDRAILDFAAAEHLPAYAGDPLDVLDRYRQAARAVGAETIVRITADDPFKDPRVIDRVVGAYVRADGALDYVSNNLQPTYPLGLDVEVVSAAALEQAWAESTDVFDREHVTSYIRRHPRRFRLGSVELDRDLSHLRWTIDTEADLAFARIVYRSFRDRPMFFMDDILALLERDPRAAVAATRAVEAAR
jgi:spore coat polysaccharide biosynthesis protein SpsF